MSPAEKMIWAATFAAGMNELDLDNDSTEEMEAISSHACARAYLAVGVFRKLAEMKPPKPINTLDMLRDMAGLTN